MKWRDIPDNGMYGRGMDRESDWAETYPPGYWYATQGSIAWRNKRKEQVRLASEREKATGLKETQEPWSPEKHRNRKSFSRILQESLTFLGMALKHSHERSSGLMALLTRRLKDLARKEELATLVAESFSPGEPEHHPPPLLVLLGAVAPNAPNSARFRRDSNPGITLPVACAG